MCRSFLGWRDRSSEPDQMRHCFLFLVLLCASPVWASDLLPRDDEMIATCRKELTERLFEGKTHGEAFVSKQALERQGERVAVRLDLASGEGRSLTGTCVFRDGKLFDIK
jgi:hypothetical protein